MADLLEKAANIGDADSARSLMNLVMQFRKVINDTILKSNLTLIPVRSVTILSCLNGQMLPPLSLSVNLDAQGHLRRRAILLFSHIRRAIPFGTRFQSFFARIAGPARWSQ